MADAAGEENTFTDSDVGTVRRPQSGTKDPHATSKTAEVRHCSHRITAARDHTMTVIERARD